MTNSPEDDSSNTLRFMARAAASGSWLPDHQAHVLYTVAYVDSTIGELGSVLHDYLAKDPLKLIPRFTPTHEDVVLAGIDPLPQSVPRLFADALNQSRNMLEHALFAEVAHRAGRSLTEKESKALEIPAAKSPDAFQQWCKHPNRRSLALFGYGAELTNRLDRIQPYQRTDNANHPLRLLVEFTNHAKHREPAVAFTRVGRVDVGTPSQAPRSAEHQEVVKIGEVLASAPRGSRVEVSIWPQVMVQRPHTGEWRTLMHEVRHIEDWVRRMALPILIEGRTDLPVVPPHLNIRQGYADVAEAWAAAGTVAAADRNIYRMTAEGLRRSIADMLVDETGEGVRATAEEWLRGQSDEEVTALSEPVGRAAARRDLETVGRLTDEWRVALGLRPRRDDS
ncbi:hypothetical protein [Microbacterium hatanonis]|uniref:Uncharacterized protein n=1 Tax=Microbacterium hatanonis TaxID=404366 RepID=A0A5C8I309_9MICO|nr:hypothetical protein [Microbacterium hatanonis]TXK12315.1 hypothetical protein FVP77_02200 [Microbacterium hatanonis]